LTLALCCTLSSWAASAAVAGIEGFTEPYREIDLASVETGILVTVDVTDGDKIHEGQLLAQLDQKVLLASLRVAEMYKESKGQLDSAKAELRLRSERLDNLKRLLLYNHASKEEVHRAETEKAVAEAQVLATTESLQIRELEYERTKAQLDQRSIRSPVDGVVKRVHKHLGEFVGPTDPVVLTIVQLDPLLATFAVPAHQIGRLAARQRVQIQIGPDKASVAGTVKSISPVVDAQSGTVTAKVEFPNPNGRFRSGNRCVLELPAGAAKVTRRP
jgi:RND family efflux transporter MFP subunit